MENETILITNKGAWGKGRTIAEAVANLPRKVKPREPYYVRLIFWRDDEAREKARSYDANRAAEGLPSWVNADGSPFVEVDSIGVVERPSGTTLAHLTDYPAAWKGARLLEEVRAETARTAGAGQRASS